MKINFVLLIVFIIASTSTFAGKYNRKLFRHWIDEDRDCQNTRAEILIKYNIGELKFKTEKECVVSSGKWVDLYSGKTFTKANDLDIDHVVTLKHSFSMGSQNWDKRQRKAFANDPINLLPVWKRLNRQKGAKGPSEWLPPNQSYQCDYVKKWNMIKTKYKLIAPARTIASIKKIVKACFK